MPRYFPPDHDRPPPAPASPSRQSRSSSSPRSRYSPSRRASVDPASLSRASPAPASGLGIRGGSLLWANGSPVLPRERDSRRSSSAMDAMAQAAIRALSERAREAERRAQWEGRFAQLDAPPRAGSAPPSAPVTSQLASMAPVSPSLGDPSLPSRPTPSCSPSSRPQSTTPSPPLNRSRSNTSTTTTSTGSRHPSLYDTANPVFPSSSSARSPRSPRSRDPSLPSNLSAVSDFLATNGTAPSSAAEPFSCTRSPRSESSRSSLAPTDAEQEDPLSAVYAPRKVGTSEMDQFVDALSGSSRSAANGKTATTAPARRGDSNGSRLSRLDDGDKKAKRRETSMSGNGWNSTAGYSSASGDDTNGTGHSRSQSASSDASFASMTAGPTPAQLAAAQERGQLSPVDERDLYMAPGMERADTHETLKASERPWLKGAEAGGGVKSIEEIVAGYKGLGISTGGEGAARRASVLSPTLSVSPTPHLAITNPPLAYVPFPSASLSNFSAPPTKVKSIDEIIAEHATPSYVAKRSAPPPTSAPSPAQAVADVARLRERESSHNSTSSLGSVDSIGAEIRASAALQNRLERGSAPSPVPSAASRSLSHTRSFSSRTPTSPTSPTFAPTSPLPPSFAAYDPSLSLDGFDSHSIHSSSHSASASTHTPTSLSPRVQSPKPYDPEPLAVERELATLLKSPRLTRLITLRRQPNTGLTVSLADVGSPTGNPVVVFLGLGSVRYLLALYDELAEVFNLRLICLDRWGLGRTSTVPDSQRGFVEWASVVDEVLTDHLALKRYSILAHSAGAPYAVASALRTASSPGKVQVHGSLHLLAPWVSTSADSLAGMYKYLKYVPSGVLKTAQAAEWKMQAWRLGKPPTLVHSPVGYDARAGKLISEVEDDKDRPTTRDQLAALSIMNGDVDKLAALYPEGGIRQAGPANGKGGISRKASSSGGKSFLGGLLRGAGNGRDRTASMRSSISDSGSDVASLRPSLSPGTGLSRRSSYFAASSLSRSNPPPASPSVDNSASTRTLASNGLPSPATPSPTRRQSLASFSTPRSPSPSHAPVLPRASSSLSLRPTSPFPPSPSHNNSTLSASALTSGLLRASHAESLAGSTSDLLVLLERTSGKKGLGFEYKDVERPIKVWYGDKDDRISVGSVRWLEKEVAGRCDVEIVQGADHALMANHKVMFDVLESIANEWDHAAK